MQIIDFLNDTLNFFNKIPDHLKEIPDHLKQIIDQLIEPYKNLPDTLKPVAITATATLFGAFVGAAVAQLISHRLTVKRELQKSNKEVYQKLYAPILLDIYAYIDISSHFRRNHDINLGVREEDILDKIKKHIGDNLIYASPKLIDHYSTVKSFYYQDDLSGFHYIIHDIELIELSLLELRKISKSIKFFDKSTLRRIEGLLVLYRIWAILVEYCNNLSDASSILAYKFYYDEKKLTYKTYKKIRKYFVTNTLMYRTYVHISSQMRQARENGRYKKFLTFIDNKYFKNFEINKRIKEIDYLYSLVTTKKYNKVELIKATQIITKEYPTKQNSTEQNSTKQNSTEQNSTEHEHSTLSHTPYYNETLFSCYENSFENQVLKIEVEINNFSKKSPKRITIDNFSLIGDRQIKPANRSPGIWNGYWYELKEKILLPGEGVRIRLFFDLKLTESKSYSRLVYTDNNESNTIYVVK
ncbi:hypothetical protein [Paenibacillus sp. ATY16]|uniref:hypothetical protein n=1 Tax=Paenibacillus sp. ATY16 TaxID=1759312 RepID=UPI00200FC032|nr:hypothetical protein [Paenibacillus sp. ATY16]MCK9858205.1 hypothetical protein [Paenibacillus sp. ATY16]